MNWQQQAQTFLVKGDYRQVAELYEQAIETEPQVMSHYWHLGVAYLLQGHEEEAQATWMLAMAEGSLEELAQWTEKLVEILEAEAQHQAALPNLQTSWLVRQHIREIVPAEVNNLLYLIQLAINLGHFTPEVLNDWQAAEYLGQTPTPVDPELLLQVLEQVLEFPTAETLRFTEACLPHFPNPQVLIDRLILAALNIAYQLERVDFAASLAELCLRLDPANLEVLKHLSSFYIQTGLHQEAVETARRFYSHSNTLPQQLFGNYLVIRSLLSTGLWKEVEPVAQLQKSLLLDLAQVDSANLDPVVRHSFIVIPAFLPYLQDHPQESRLFQNQAAQLFQRNLPVAPTPTLLFNQQDRRLKIGYIAHTLRKHSVGWLSRWIFHYHNRELFQTAIYFISQAEDEVSRHWFREKVDSAQSFGVDAQAIAAKIKEDQIDILVDLDSITCDVTCKVMALKPAPIQVTWLGWDASGLPAIDYFMADPYVLPENAQEYYQETIWRLPQTYVAVDGFEVGVPTLHRDQLQIPSDAIIYLSAQTGFKRHPDTARVQMKILKEIPNSYFLIKGLGDQAAIQQFFTQLAESEGVDPARLRFLSRDPNEFVHRANLGIADIVLDTYPFNGATTTLETLWMGIPLVTRVGQQFAARNSYAFMMNVGVTEGIAWTDEEYIEWGVRLGKDAALRQQVAWKLKASRQASPLWNAKQFTCDMETAFQQMWARYVEEIAHFRTV